MFRKFLEKYTKKQTPDRSTLRTNYVSICYDETIQMIRSYVKNKKYGFLSMKRRTPMIVMLPMS